MRPEAIRDAGRHGLVYASRLRPHYVVYLHDGLHWQRRETDGARRTGQPADPQSERCKVSATLPDGCHDCREARRRQFLGERQTVESEMQRVKWHEIKLG